MIPTSLVALQCAIALDAAPGEHKPSRTRAARVRLPCTHPALRIIRRCGSFQSFFLVSSPMVTHSQNEGKRRFSGLAFHSASVPPVGARPGPRRVSFCLRVSHSQSEGTR